MVKKVNRQAFLKQKVKDSENISFFHKRVKFLSGADEKLDINFRWPKGLISYILTESEVCTGNMKLSPCCIEQARKQGECVKAEARLDLKY